jgi:type III secretion system YscQ/HrcQ family protein
VDTAPTRLSLWRPRPVTAVYATERERIARAWIGPSAEIALPRFAELLGAESGRARVSRIGPAAPFPEDSVIAALSTASEAQRPVAALSLPLDAARRIVDAALRRSHRPSTRPLTSGEEGVFLYAVDRAGGDWLATGGAQYRVTGLLADQGQIAELLGAAPGHEVELSLAAGDIAARVRIAVAAPFTPRSAARCKGGFGRALGWPVSFRCKAGSARIPTSEIGALAAGDVVVLDRCGHPAATGRDRECALECGGVHLAARWLDDRRLVLVSQSLGSSKMTDDTTNQLEVRMDAPVDGAAMEVVAQVEVGRLTLTVEQALGLVPGRVLALDRDVGPDVWIRVGDKLVARGELVSCDGRLAVEVTEVP